MSLRERRDLMAQIPLLINPSDVKKEFDSRPTQAITPSPFLEQDSVASRSNGHEEKKVKISKKKQDSSSSSSSDSSSDSEDDKKKRKKKKQTKSKVKNGKRSKSPSSESLTSCSTDKSGKQKMKKRRLESLQKNSPSSSSGTSSVHKAGSIEEGRQMFGWIIDPVSLEDFFSATWEKRPLYICREMPEYYSALLSTEKFDKMLRENDVLFTKNIDITSYKNDKRETLNPEGRALPAQVWDFYNKGCSIRLLNPQTFINRIWALNAMLQEYFGCFVGANTYLTPAGTQGFAPHYDDIEAFVLQLEGKKRWRLYSPRTAEEELPCTSSENFQQNEIGSPIMDVILEAGDLLYFPRGTIHQANALPESHSLHITISCYQKNTWGHFLEKMLPAALEAAMEEDVEFRRGLPRDYLQHLGVAHSERNSNQRALFLDKLRGLTDKLFRYAPVDAAADQMSKEFLHSALPPKLDNEEASCTSYQNSARMAKGKVVLVAPLDLKTRVRLLRANVCRVVSEGDDVMLYHSLENSREFRREELQYFEIQPEEAQAIESLLHTYPDYCVIGNLAMDSDKEKLQLANMLWKKGLLMTAKPLEVKEKA